MTATKSKKTTKTEAKSKKAATMKLPAKKPRQTMSALDAAAKVLSETTESLNCQQMIDLMASKGYWTSPNGQTPAQTLYAAVTREINVKGPAARFQKTERGKFNLKKTA